MWLDNIRILILSYLIAALSGTVHENEFNLSKFPCYTHILTDSPRGVRHNCHNGCIAPAACLSIRN